MTPEGIDGESEAVEIKLLKAGLSPRVAEQDLEHAKALAHRLDDCPPVIVHRATMTIIDGVHRILAAKMLGRKLVKIRYFDGSFEEAYFEGVRANVTHGKPLTLSERELAATKILEMRGEWSNRLVGDMCALSDKTVARLRAAMSSHPDSGSRIGRDGRKRPLGTSEVRTKIATAILDDPRVSTKKLAESFVASPSTIRDVRRRLERGEEPIVRNRRVTDVGYQAPPTQSSGLPIEWSKDPAINALPNGLAFGRWLDLTSIKEIDWLPTVEIVPLGRIPHLINEGRLRAIEWGRFVSTLEERARKLNRRH